MFKIVSFLIEMIRFLGKPGRREAGESSDATLVDVEITVEEPPV